MRPLTPAWRQWYLRSLPAYWMFLTFSTHVPNLQLHGAPPDSDKALHFAAFGLLAFLFWRFWFALNHSIHNTFAPLACGGLMIYAAIDEYTQQFVGRSSDWADFLADSAGIALTLAVLEIRRRRA